MGFAWKGLFPLSVINFFVVAVELFVLQEPDGTITNQSMMIMTGINWVVMVVSIVLIATVLGQGKLQHKLPPRPSSLANMAASEGD